MDALLDDRWKAGLSPFDGDCLRLMEPIELSKLRTLLVGIVNVLRNYSRGKTLLQFEDWHEHDGFITQPSDIDWMTIEKILKDDESLYAARCDDDYVHSAFYPNDFSFLFRFYILDDDPGYPGIYGDCDVSGSSSLIEDVKFGAPSMPGLSITNAKEYFDKAYAG